jgi:hypothetical protein
MAAAITCQNQDAEPLDAAHELSRTTGVHWALAAGPVAVVQDQYERRAG